MLKPGSDGLSPFPRYFGYFWKCFQCLGADSIALTFFLFVVFSLFWHTIIFDKKWFNFLIILLFFQPFFKMLAYRIDAIRTICTFLSTF